jgi:hypothetical protein
MNQFGSALSQSSLLCDSDIMEISNRLKITPIDEYDEMAISVHSNDRHKSYLTVYGMREIEWHVIEHMKQGGTGYYRISRRI